MDKMKLYGLMPVWVQEFACWYEGRNIRLQRYGANFQKALTEYESHNGWSYERMCDWRDGQLRKLVHHCYDTVPYYHKLFDEGGINPDSIRTVDDLKRLPVLTKDVIKKDPSQFLSSKYRADRLAEISTSGSTGSSLVLKVLPENIAQQYAIWWRYRQRLGIDFKMWHSEFGSRIIVPTSTRNPPYWRTSSPLKQVMFSAFHGNESTFHLYYEKMRKDGFNWIHATPSVIMPFAAYCVEHELSFEGQIKVVTTGAENLYEHQRILLREAFGVMPRTHYGLTEAVANFSERPDGVMEVDEDFAAVEFLPEDDYHHIIGTSLINYTMPLLRYDTSDICFFSDKIGEHGRVVDGIDGRNGDCIILPNGTRIGTLSALFSETRNVVEAQIYQKSDYSLSIRYVPRNEHYVDDLKKVKGLLDARVNNAVPVQFECMEKIPRTGRGKLRYIISEIKR